jgi:hypothetical protein
MSREQENFIFLVSGFEVEAAPPGPRIDPDPRRQPRAQPMEFMRRAREVSITPEQLASFWREKVVALSETLGRAQEEEQAPGFHIDEISFSIGVGAKGGVAFVAEGSVEATISITLRRDR